MAVDPLSSPPVSTRRHWLIRFLSSIWLGVALLTVIVVYSSVVSALPPVRWALELTDMSAFRHGFFVAVSLLFALSLVVTTVVRSRWTAWNAGAVTTHLGLIILIGGAVAYFGTKIEGDVLLQAPAILVRVAGDGQPVTIARFRAVPGATWSRALPPVGTRATATVQSVDADGIQPAARAQVRVQLGDNPAQLLTLAARPDDWQPAGAGLELQLTAFAPQQYFYASEEPVLYLQPPGQREPLIKPLAGLPIHRERYLAEGEPLRDAQGNAVPSRRTTPTLKLGSLQIPTGWFETWRMPLTVDSAGVPFRIRVTGYVPVVRGLQPVTLPDGAPGEAPILEVRERRRADTAPRAMSAIRLELSALDDSWRQSRWVLFSQYPDVESQPLEFTPPGGGEPWKITYSRQRHPLGATVALRRAFVEYFPGERGVESFFSDIVVQPRGGPLELATVHTNQTFALGRWTLFQSGFDGQEHWRYTILGVGNRVGMWPMNVGWVLVTLGCLYAFYVKPLLIRRLRKASARAAAQSPPRDRTRSYAATVRAAAWLIVGFALVHSAQPAHAKDEPLAASARAAQLDGQIDWTAARLIVVQDSGRYKTLESLAREAFADMTRKEHLPGLSPLASLFEWVFNRDAYLDSPLIKVKEAALRDRLSESFPDARRTQVLSEKLFTPRELLDPGIDATLRELETQPLSRRAANRVRTAQTLAEHLHRLVRIVPQPGGDKQPEWHTPTRLLANLTPTQLANIGYSRATLPDEARGPIPNLAPEQAFPLAVAWLGLESAWRSGDAVGVQKYLQTLADGLPRLAGPGVYPSLTQRQAEVTYYQRGKFTGGWVLYFLALLLSIPALVTRWRWPWWAALALILAALVFHGYGLYLRWSILGRIPVANMFEAVVAAFWIGTVVAVLLELWLRSGLFLVAASTGGWLALIAAGYVLPGGELGTIPGILDDIQLRIHTVMIIAAYALIFLAAVIAVIYLIGYYAVRKRVAPATATVAGAAGLSPGAGSVAALSLAGAPMGVSLDRPLLAGAAPGDEAHGQELPGWLNAIDWSHLILLNMAFVLLFLGGIILGAWWADYSWGRPWGWDPKEVFALNTWLIYAILLHVRFVVRKRGLWTAWLSIVGCAMMAFNWFFVNFFINSVHSYA